MIRLNKSKFCELQGERNESEMAAYIGVSRAQLWRIKRGECSAGEEFISKVMSRYPKMQFGDIFFND